MKKNILMLLVLGSVFSFGCASCEKKPTEPKVMADYTAALEKNMSCKVDADCVSVPKGCCLCSGRAAVNKKHADKLDSLWIEVCSDNPCTLQMCYVEIDPACVDGKCVGPLKVEQGLPVAM